MNAPIGECELTANLFTFGKTFMEKLVEICVKICRFFGKLKKVNQRRYRK